MTAKNESPLQNVPERWRPEFSRFLDTGEAAFEFLEFLDSNQDCQKALEAALATQASGLAAIGSQVERMFAQKAQAAGPRRSRARAVALAANILVLSGLLATSIYFWGAHQTARDREAAWQTKWGMHASIKDSQARPFASVPVVEGHPEKMPPNEPGLTRTIPIPEDLEVLPQND